MCARITWLYKITKNESLDSPIQLRGRNIYIYSMDDVRAATVAALLTLGAAHAMPLASYPHTGSLTINRLFSVSSTILDLVKLRDGVYVPDMLNQSLWNLKNWVSHVIHLAKFLELNKNQHDLLTYEGCKQMKNAHKSHVRSKYNSSRRRGKRQSRFLVFIYLHF